MAARKRAYLWSFKPAHIRPAFYLGAVLALWPVMGIQLLLAFLASYVMRANVMVTGALQFITNPITAAPVYYLTYRVGKLVLLKAGVVSEMATKTLPAETLTIAVAVNDTLPRHFDWSSTFGTTVMALFVGGTICGLGIGGLLDFIYSIVGRTNGYWPRKNACGG